MESRRTRNKGSKLNPIGLIAIVLACISVVMLIWLLVVLQGTIAKFMQIFLFAIIIGSVLGGLVWFLGRVVTSVATRRSENSPEIILNTIYRAQELEQPQKVKLLADTLEDLVIYIGQSAVAHGLCRAISVMQNDDHIYSLLDTLDGMNIVVHKSYWQDDVKVCLNWNGEHEFSMADPRLASVVTEWHKRQEETTRRLHVNWLADIPVKSLIRDFTQSETAPESVRS